MHIPTDVMQFHAEMLNDKTRTSSYLTTIRSVVRPGDVVLDIGTGTGILAIAAAQAGAAHVYAIEAGSIWRAARRLIAANGLADRITLLHGWSTRIRLPERADVLVSELIGNDPLAEGVIGITRDALRRLLKPGARLIPSRIKLFGLPVAIPDEEVNKLTVTPQTLQNWRLWYGIAFDPLTGIARRSRFNSCFGYLINSYRMRTWRPLSSPVLLADLDLKVWNSPWVRTTGTAVADVTGQLNGMIMYFELDAGSSSFLSTHPARVDEHNHWLSAVRLFPRPISLHSGDRFEIIYWYRPIRGFSGCEIRVGANNRKA